MSSLIKTFERLLSRARNWNWFFAVTGLGAWVVSAMTGLILGAVAFIKGRPVDITLLMVIVTFSGVLVILNQIKKMRSGRPEKANFKEMAIENALHVCNLNLSFSNLSENLYFELIIPLFNGSVFPLVLQSVEGNILYEGVINAENRKSQRLETLVFRNVFGQPEFPNGESLILLEQRVKRSIAEPMANAFSEGKSLEFSFSQLNVYVVKKITPLSAFVSVCLKASFAPHVGT